MKDPLSGSVTLTADGYLAAILLAVDPSGLRGACLRGGPGPEREAWIGFLRRLLPDGSPWRRMPSSIPDDRLLGGLDLAATLSAGRPVIQRGLLAEADQGMIVVPMAERVERSTAARIAAAMDQGSVDLVRDGTSAQHQTDFAVVLFDEGTGEEEAPPPALVDRIAFCLPLTRSSDPSCLFDTVDQEVVTSAKAILPDVEIPPAIEEAICGAALAFGVFSPRLSVLAVRAALASAAVQGRRVVEEEDATLAVRLVLAPRATQMPVPEDSSSDPEQDQERDPPLEDQTRDELNEMSDRDVTSLEPEALQDLMIEAAKTALPSNLLAGLATGTASRGGSVGGKAGAQKIGARRGRPVGSRRGVPRPGQRLHVLDTLRAAAPWQTLRKRERAQRASKSEDRSITAPRVEVRKDDFRIIRVKERGETLTLFVVDASGSAALNRLSEAKGAVELLLAECYVRRDSVAMIAFSGKGTETLLPPTRSLTRAKRELTAMPGGGGTPLASGILAAMAEAEAARRRGQTPVVVFMTDGNANIARDGTQGRGPAGADALLAARQFRGMGVSAVLVDISPRAKPVGKELAASLGARYVPLPYADAAHLSQAIEKAS